MKKKRRKKKNDRQCTSQRRLQTGAVECGTTPRELRNVPPSGFFFGVVRQVIQKLLHFSEDFGAVRSLITGFLTVERLFRYQPGVHARCPKRHATTEQLRSIVGCGRVLLRPTTPAVHIRTLLSRVFCCPARES